MADTMESSQTQESEVALTQIDATQEDLVEWVVSVRENLKNPVRRMVVVFRSDSVPIADECVVEAFRADDGKITGFVKSKKRMTLLSWRKVLPYGALIFEAPPMKQLMTRFVGMRRAKEGDKKSKQVRVSDADKENSAPKRKKSRHPVGWTMLTPAEKKLYVKQLQTKSSQASQRTETEGSDSDR